MSSTIEIKISNVYVLTNTDNVIVDINSDVFLTDTTNWTQVDSGHGDKYYHAQNNYLANTISDENGVYNYKLVDGVVTERTEEDKYDDILAAKKNLKIRTLDLVHKGAIYDGVTVTLSDGTTESFTFTEEDQIRVSNISVELSLGAETVIWYHNVEDNSPCKFYSAADAKTIIAKLLTHENYHIAYFRDLQLYINGLTTIEEVDAIEYGYSLPEDAKSEVLKQYETNLLAL